MKSSIEALNELTSRYDDDWKQILDSYLKDDDEVPKEAREYIDEFLFACKEDMISERQDNWKKLEGKIKNDLLYDNLRNRVKESLSAYYIAAPLRALDAQDAGKASKVVQDIFERAILRFDIKFIDKYEKCGFPNQDALIEFLNVLDNFCSYMVERNFGCSTIEGYARNIMRFSPKLCKQIAEIIDENFRQFQISYIIDNLKMIREDEK